MKTRRYLAAALTLAAALSGASLFADSRHDDRTDRGRWSDSRQRVVTLEGRIRDIDRDRNGFVIRLRESSYRVFAPVNAEVRHASRSWQRGRVRQLEQGDVIRVRGRVDRGNLVLVNSVELLRERSDRRRATLEGVVESVDHNRGVLWLREERSRRTIAVEMDRSERRYDGYGYDFRDVRRGDRVTVTGTWRSDRFEARYIDRQARAWW